MVFATNYLSTDSNRNIIIVPIRRYFPARYVNPRAIRSFTIASNARNRKH